MVERMRETEDGEDQTARHRRQEEEGAVCWSPVERRPLVMSGGQVPGEAAIEWSLDTGHDVMTL